MIGLDYRGERARLAVDIGYQADNLNPPLRFFTVGSSIIPPPPKPGSNFQVPWAYYAPTDFFSTVRGEVDVTDQVTAYAAFGYHDSNINYAYPSPIISNAVPGALASPPGAFQLGGLRSTPFTGRRPSRRWRAKLVSAPRWIPGRSITRSTSTTRSMTAPTRSESGCSDSARIDLLESVHRADQYPALPNFTTLAANQLTGVDLVERRRVRHHVDPRQARPAHGRRSSPDRRQRGHELS